VDILDRSREIAMNTRETEDIRRASDKVAMSRHPDRHRECKNLREGSMDEIVSLAEKLLPRIRELRHTTEKDRRIAEPIVQAIRESDLCRMLLDTGARPRCTPYEWLTVLEILAGAEASVSWLVWNNTLACFWSRFLNEAGHERIFGDSSRLFAGSTRPTGRAVITEGGSRVSGRWSLVSGCELADYLHLMSLVYDDGEPRMLAPGQPDLRVLFVPKGSYEILDTWHAGGLRGSGSHDVVVDDVFVPVEDSFAPAPPVDGNSQLAQLPIVPVMVAGIGAQFLGMARAAIAVTVEILRNKVSVDPGASIGERPSVLADVASCSAALAAAASHLHASMTAVWDKAGRHVPTAEDRAALYSAGLHAATVARAGVVAMHSAAGTTALYIDCPLERSLRDLQTMERHIAAQPLWLEDAGRVLLGHRPTNPLFMI
jgi:alkylation response protein AidB-like acyl-CoA dehydrogenase